MKVSRNSKVKCVHFLIDVVHGVAVVVAETFKLEARTQVTLSRAQNRFMPSNINSIVLLETYVIFF